jgi:23S rRNA (guanine745-N1)-methyltransferase
MLVGGRCGLSSILVIAGWPAVTPERDGAEAGVLDDVVGYLRCPHCGAGLTRTGGSLRCPAGHSFDIARQGYVSLLQPGVAGAAGDTAAMVRARREFLATGHFAPIAAALADAAAASVAGLSSGCVVDVGAGTGYYLAAVLARLPGHAGVALDVSRHALRAAARAHRRIGAVGCDAWRPLPVADSAAGLVLNVFAPRDGAELRRILRPDGRLLLITPAADHLSELTGPLGLLHVDERKRDRLTGKLGPHLDLIAERECRGVMSLDKAAVAALAAMGPTAWHTRPDATAGPIARLPEPVAVTLAVTVSVLQPRR